MNKNVIYTLWNPPFFLLFMKCRSYINTPLILVNLLVSIYLPRLFICIFSPVFFLIRSCPILTEIKNQLFRGPHSSPMSTDGSDSMICRLNTKTWHVNSYHPKMIRSDHCPFKNIKFLQTYVCPLPSFGENLNLCLAFRSNYPG